MTIFIHLLFLIDLSMAQSESINFNFPTIKGPRRSINESVTLGDIDDRGTFCKGDSNVIFPDPFAYNIYYRCQGTRRETWKCNDDLVFDPESRRCVQKLEGGAKTSFTTDVCNEQEDGLYPLYSTYCKQFVRCKGGVTIEENQCPPNEFFSYHSQSCRFKSDAACVQSFCEQDNDGFFISPGTKCQAYYYCRKGKRLDFICPRGQNFDIRTKRCVDGGICYEPICTGRTNGIYADTTHNCERYFRCTGGEMQEITSCPQSLKHNGFTCALASSVKCEGPEKTSAAIYNRLNDECKLLEDGNHIIPDTDCRKIRTCSDGSTIGTMECPNNYSYNGIECLPNELTECDDLCVGKPDGHYPDKAKQCRQYYSCYNGKMVDRKTCENGTAFNGQICFPATLVSCSKSKQSENFCEGLPNGLHPDYVNGCRNYIYCHDQQVIYINKCPEDMKWNRSQCVHKTKFQCDEPKQLTQCKGLAAGLYQDWSSKCKNYIYCKNDMGTILSCSNDEIYDGNKCKNANEYTCPSETRDECFNQEDGYRQDVSSNCRSYYFCSKGNKITYVCDGNYVFNGTTCVSPNLYMCPHDADDCDGKYNGYYPDETKNCKKYYFCLNGRRITTLNCAGEKIFNGNACALVSDVKKACARAVSNPCFQRQDGLYPDRRLQCEKYIRCKNQIMTEELFCSPGTSFNGVDCSPHPSCFSKPEENPCAASKTGFIPDYLSGCKNYYFCVGNVKMLAVCPEGTIFNGRVCQNSNTYKCPKESEVD